MKYKSIFIYSVGFGTVRILYTVIASSHFALLAMIFLSSFKVASQSNEMSIGTLMAMGYPLTIIKDELSQYIGTLVPQHRN